MTALSSDVSETFDSRIGWEEPETSIMAVFILGMVLSILVYFSPCAFPVLPGFISYYLSLGAREDELIEQGKLKTGMPSSFNIGILSGLGMWTFFGFIGILALLMGEFFASSGIIHTIAIFVAVLLIVLGTMMLLGVTSHVMGFVQNLVDKYSTTEMDETFTPRRNMYLYGIGYAAASIDCTAAAVLPFVIRKPIIAAINGACAGLGFAIATIADLRVVERQAKFSTAFSQRGLIAEHGVSWTLPRLIGSGNALDLLWSARKFNGEEASEIGLAERLVETGEALATAQDYVRNLAASAAPVSLQVMKAQVYRHLNMPLADAMHETNDWMAQSLTKDDFREGVRSFIEKRPPKFTRVTV